MSSTVPSTDDTRLDELAGSALPTIHAPAAGTLRIATISIALGFVTAGCLSSDPYDEVTGEIVHNLRLAGYPDTEIAVGDDGVVIVGGDAVVSLEASREMIAIPGGKEVSEHEHGEHKQYRTHNLVAASIENICVDGSALSGKLSIALNNAIANYNALGLRFQFTRTSGNNTGCDAVITAKVVGGTGGSAGFPSGGLPYHEINLGIGLTGFSTAVATHVTAHELGHCIGFRHTDYFNRSISCGAGGNEGQGGVGAVHIPNTPTGATFNGSVMNSCFNAGSTGVWTSSDVTALRELYGGPTPLVVPNHSFEHTSGSCGVFGVLPSSWTATVCAPTDYQFAHPASYVPHGANGLFHFNIDSNILITESACIPIPAGAGNTLDLTTAVGKPFSAMTVTRLNYWSSTNCSTGWLGHKSDNMTNWGSGCHATDCTSLTDRDWSVTVPSNARSIRVRLETYTKGTFIAWDNLRITAK